MLNFMKITVRKEKHKTEKSNFIWTLNCKIWQI